MTSPMSRYDRQFDFGLRGYRETTRPVMGAPRAYDFGYRARYDERADPEGRAAKRVTARYNLDYVIGPDDERYVRRQERFPDAFPSDMGDESSPRRPSRTDGMRGRDTPNRYDWMDYGAPYHGRFPDEI